jgi:hypothetical protein
VHDVRVNPNDRISNEKIEIQTSIVVSPEVAV